MVERRHFEVQEAMIIFFDHLILNQLFELLQIEHHARNRVRLAFERHLQHVIVAMAVRIGGCAEQFFVFTIGQTRIPAGVGSREFDALGDQHLWCELPGFSGRIQ